ncbi:thioesterase family protein [Bacillus sp. B15-48]|uniref:acyl-CoA thioesterase n=1 Tax=Bacillus sp. B15-48 TaxID=1548601 RepID=UPI00193F787C|nr:thioesterase family protein [Bacillus sp. B15-48]MBM4763766.1 acyl-CoA thioesterase [Bacillus sp. B15-48]
MIHETTVRVRFSETDALGHVSNTSYFIYLEEARMKFFETLGFNIDAGSINFISASVKCDFISQSYYNQELTIQSTISKIGTKSFIVMHKIHDTKGSLIALGQSSIVFFNFEKQQTEKIPEELRARLEQYLSKNPLKHDM